MAEAYFSIIVWTHDTQIDEFKNLLESVDEQDYREFELYIMDENPGNSINTTITEFFPDIMDKAHYRKLKNAKGGAYAYNIGAHFAEGTHILFVGQHDRLNPNTLSEINKKIDEVAPENDTVYYTDHDELVGLDRMNPHFKCDFNKELFYHTDYIGGFICISTECYKKLGNLNEKASESYIYEYLMRCEFKRLPIWHVTGLLYHKRAASRPVSKEEKKRAAYIQKEFMAVASSYLSQANVLCNIVPTSDYKKWDIEYDSSSFRRFGGDYMFLREEGVKLYTRKNVQYMYGFLKQPDVAVVGVRFIDSGLTIDNIGYIYDENGIEYPAFHGQKILKESYDDLARLPRDVALVDASCCLIDEKVYRMLHGFDPRLSGRDAMLDFCIRARAKGFRTVVVPRCIARNKNKNNDSSGMSHDYLVEKHKELLSKGDGFYNKNLPVGLQNFILPGTEEEGI